MSDFLSQFDPDRYKKEKEVQPVVQPQVSSMQTDSGEAIEFDMTYQKRRKQKFIWIGAIIVAVLLLVGIFYYQFTRVNVPDFNEQDLTKVRAWATENNMTLEVQQEYSAEIDVNQVIAQAQKAGSKLKKGSPLSVTFSLGPDPNESLKLPDFMKIDRAEAEAWIEENQATNITVIEEYSEKVEVDAPLRFEITNKDVSEDSYKRKDQAKLYYSKGVETFEKDIPVPDFKGKGKHEVESWADTHEIEIKYKEDSSDVIEPDHIIRQNIKPEEKIAKRGKMTVTVSLGKAIIVPDFSKYTPEEASEAAEGLQIRVKNVLTENTPYGRLVSQSIAAGTELTSKDDVTITVKYSEGRPYLKDIRGELEGDLEKIFYESFETKGANVRYTVRYVDSEEPKGTVVGMNDYNTFIPLNYTVRLKVSTGKVPR